MRQQRTKRTGEKSGHEDRDVIFTEAYVNLFYFGTEVLEFSDGGFHRLLDSRIKPPKSQTRIKSDLFSLDPRVARGEFDRGP
ncbi:hypothetical protein WK41_32440 [Burkholderia cepacia]|nr:hypothetical protein WK41_32440 [Burkholderia cepacia]